MDKNKISSYLYLGYVPEIPADLFSEVWCKYRNQEYQLALKSMNEEDLINLGIKAIKSPFANIGKGHHVLPLSGGLDSRAILGGLLEAGMAENIVAVTFGAPGSLDYEIGTYLSKKYRLKFEAVDLTKIITQDALYDTSKEINSLMWLFDVFYNRVVVKIFGKNAVYWSGYLGDRLAGLKLIPDQENQTWEDAVDWFIRKNKFIKSAELVHPGFSLQEQLPRKPLLLKEIISYDEQLSFAIRQSYLKKVLIPKNYHYEMPFLYSQWVEFIINVPIEYRKNKYLYKKILKKAYPALFAEPIKTLEFTDNTHIRQLFFNIKIFTRYFISNLILPRKTTFPMTNYVDFKKSIKYRKEFKQTIHDNVMDLQKRGIVDWLSLPLLWDQHEKGLRNHALALTELASLEIYYKANHDHNKDFLQTKMDLN